MVVPSVLGGCDKGSLTVLQVKYWNFDKHAIIKKKNPLQVINI